MSDAELVSRHLHPIVAARFVVVDAISDDAATFYTHYGYRPMPNTSRLVRKVSDLADDLRSG